MAAQALLKKVMRGGEATGLRRLLDLLFRNFAACDSQAKGVVTLDRAERVLEEECPAMDATALEPLLSAFVESKSDCVRYPEMLSFLSCCSSGAVMQRLYSLDLIRQRQGYNFKTFLQQNGKKGGKKLDAQRLADQLVGLGMLLPDSALQTVFASYGDRATRVLNVETFVAALEDAGDADPNKPARNARQNVPSFIAKDGKCAISQALLKAYDERVTRCVQMAFDAFDKNNNNELPEVELERVLCSLGFSCSQDEVDDLLAKIDPRNSGFLEYNDFMAHIMPFLRDKYSSAAFLSLEKFRVFFESLDINGDGTLSHAEFQHAVQSTASSLSDAEVTAMVNYLDQDADGIVSFAEFVQLYSLLQAEQGGSSEVNELPIELRGALRKIQYSSMPQPERFLTMFQGLPASFRKSVLADVGSSHPENQLGSIVCDENNLRVDARPAPGDGLAVNVRVNQLQFEVQVVRVSGVPSEVDARSEDVLHR